MRLWFPLVAGVALAVLIYRQLGWSTPPVTVVEAKRKAWGDADSEARRRLCLSAAHRRVS